MIIEYLLFLWAITPWAKSLIYYALGKSKKLFKDKKVKRQARSPFRNSSEDGAMLIFWSIPYIASYYYADLKFLWIILGISYLLTGILILTMGTLAFIGSKHYSEEIKKYELKYQKSNKNINYWSKWQEKSLCILQYTIFALWLYSWRHLIA